MNAVVVRYGEIGTKSRQTRSWFERILVNNIREALISEGIGYKEIVARHGRIIVKTNEAEKATEVLARVFGIVSLSPAMEVEASLEKINKIALRLFRRTKRSLSLERPRFRVTARRITKELPLTSVELQAKVGEYILEHEEAEVDLRNYDIEVGIEVMEGKAYIFTEKVKGWGGLPLGTQGKVVVLLSGPNSALAAFLMMKRGVEVIPFHVKESEEELENVRVLWRKLKRYAYGGKGELVVAEVPKEKMIEKAVELAKDFGAKGIVSGRRAEKLTEALGDALIEENAKCPLPIYYPLIALPKEYLEGVRKRAGL
ncbi:tRNA 4-thiouridine(8) synthase ThiI [Pyrococcus yayanosii]|uniref:Thiamine biosynthesis protein (ThiI) n=1 Tax=Pyrococcus yayanosii (strain CH1 / JCM 16557) TaxID=529709 RepID=F8AJ54_PYRYC|nr:tRNA 4-thiouridine(8) synthase ThiI [Pyrococcus yayanosii]AEH24849.1 Thiamine biosynthesis protein (ThiI) [Pyrococcus yayanosii CH1]